MSALSLLALNRGFHVIIHLHPWVSPLLPYPVPVLLSLILLLLPMLLGGGTYLLYLLATAALGYH